MPRKPLIRTLAILTLVFTVATALTAGAAEYFPRDLREGDEGLDVYNLQVALNGSAETQVAFSGAGSPGSETRYFGALTKAALVRYQTVKKITPADGVANATTRAALNKTLAALVGTPTSSSVGATSSTSTAQPAASLSQLIDDSGILSRLPDGSRKTLLDTLTSSSGGLPANYTTGIMVLFPDQTRGTEAGKILRLYGFGFRAGTEYKILNAANGKHFADAFATSSAVLEFKVPTVKAGEYTVYALGEEGQSNEVSFFVSGRSRPTITAVDPKEIKIGDVVTVRGRGFGKDAQISTSFGDVASSTVKRKGGSSTLIFTSEIGINLTVAPFFAPASSTVPAQLYVTTSKGVSDPYLIYAVF